MELVRGDISSLDRATIEALIVLEVHNRNIVKELKDEGVDKVNDFKW